MVRVSTKKEIVRERVSERKKKVIKRLVERVKESIGEESDITRSRHCLEVSSLDRTPLQCVCVCLVHHSSHPLSLRVVIVVVVVIMAETLTNEVLATLDNYEKPVDEPGSSKSVTYKKDLVWRNILAMIFLHIGAIYGYIVLGLDPSIPWFGLFWVDLMTRIGSVGVTAGSHRLWCHRSYKAKLPLRIVLMILHTFSLQVFDWI